MTFLNFFLLAKLQSISFIYHKHYRTESLFNNNREILFGHLSGFFQSGKKNVRNTNTWDKFCGINYELSHDSTRKKYG